jgi:transcriptional regulator GlxA family with amidase domain
MLRGDSGVQAVRLRRDGLSTFDEFSRADAALRVLMAAMLAAHRASRTPPSTVACIALDTVRRRAGRVSCERLALTLGLSDRHFRRHVRDSAGVPPKTYARLLRFVDAMRTADRSGHPVWVDVAVSAGYFDQSHFIRDFTAAIGLTPVAYAQACLRKQEPVRA